ncbi:dTDP-glucose 4,6-dehydratase [Candidatus Bipolaricaulota bacterium]
MTRNDHSPNPQDRTPKTLLVTGGAGFIGSNFIRHMLATYDDIRIVNYDKLTYAGNLENLANVEDDHGLLHHSSPITRYFFVRGDICDRKLVNSLFSGEYFATHPSPMTDDSPKIDAIVNFAAESHVDRSILDATPFVDTNVKGTHVLLEAIRRHPVERFVHISTDEVYGALGRDGVFTETSAIRPNSPYAACKAAADLIALAYANTYDLPVIVTRSSNNYGPYQFPEKLIPLMIRNALTGKELPVYGEGKQVRDWLYVEDNCRGIDAVLHRGRIGEIYNIGGDCERQNIDVVRQICSLLEEELGKSSALVTHHSSLHELIEFIEDPRGAAHDFRYALDYAKIMIELEWSPRCSFDEGLQRTVSWYLDQREWAERIVTGEYQEYYDRVYGE